MNQLLLRRRNSIDNIKPILLCFTSMEDGSTLSLDKVGNPNDNRVVYSINDGAFTEYVYGTQITLNNEETLTIKRKKSDGTITSFSKSDNDYYSFHATGQIYCNGCITSLLKYNGIVKTIGNNCFNSLFPDDSGMLVDVIIPETVNRILAGSTFRTCATMTSISIPENCIVGLDNAVFAYCKKLKKIYIQNDGSNYHRYSFYECSSLTELHVGEGVLDYKNTKQYMFWKCYSLTKVIFDSIESICKSDFGGGRYDMYYTGPFDQTHNGNIYIDDTPINNLVIPDSITYIEDGFLRYVKNILTVTFPSTFKQIKGVMLQYCSNLQWIKFLSTTPPTITSNSLAGLKTGTIIYVPDESVDIYKNTQYWSSKAQYIRPISSM